MFTASVYRSIAQVIKTRAKHYNYEHRGQPKGPTVGAVGLSVLPTNRRTQRTQPTQIDFKEYICIALDGFATLSHRL